MSHNETVKTLFKAVVDAESNLSRIKTVAENVALMSQQEVKAAQYALDDALTKLETLMKENGVVEEIVEGTANNYKLYFKKGQGRVIVAEEAVPDEFCKIETKRTPKLKDIREHLDNLTGQQKPIPNWAKIEPSESRLNWKPIKKKTEAP